MRILYVGNFRENWTTEYYIANSFEELGHEVKRLEESQIDYKIILEEVKKNYNFFLYARLRISGDKEYVLSNIRIPKVCWLFDLMIGSPKTKMLKKEFIQMADYFFTTDNGHQKEYSEFGLEKHQCIRQGIYNKEAVIGKYDRLKKTDILFIGNIIPWFGYRQQFINFLMKHYGTRFLFPRRSVRGLELNNFIASAKVVVGDTVYSKDYWSNRAYEMLGRGAFLIHPYIEGMEKEFEDKKHLVFYERNNFKDLTDKIDYYLKNNKEREEIKLQGFEYCKNNLTYIHRCKELLNKINL